MRVEASDGWVLDVRHLPAQGPRRGVAVLGHAMMVDRRSMDRPEGAGFASTLAARGWEVLLADVRGRGASGPRPTEGGSWTYDDVLGRDLPALVDAAREAFPGAFVWLVGHSLCGHGSVAAAGSGLYREPPDGHVLLAANAWMPRLEPSRRRRWQKRLSVAAFDAVQRLIGYVPVRRFGLGPADEAGPYAADIVRTWRSDRWGSRDGRLDYFAALPRVRGPVLNVVGRGDSLLAHHVGARLWTERMPQAEFWLVGRGDHELTFDPDHMTLVTDPRARPLWQAIADWMQAQTPFQGGSDSCTT